MNQNTNPADYKLTQYSHGAGCGCKISPKVLDTILKNQNEKKFYPQLLVGNEERDDAAVLDLGDGSALISTTDFFMPIVDDAFNFGYIASVNAISDVYAMGGKPLMAVAILGWPIDKIPAEVANQVVEGSRAACAAAHIPLAGGHSIDTTEPIFGLAVTGKIQIENIKKNAGAQVGDLLFLTKPLGVGIFSTAQKKGMLQEDHARLSLNSMKALNTLGETFGTMSEVHAQTDVTGFGLLGHLVEMCEASHVSAEILSEHVPLLSIKGLDFYLEHKCFPGGTLRNFESYGTKISELTEKQKYLFCDPQTSGGLLVAVAKENVDDFSYFLHQNRVPHLPIGNIIEKKELTVYVK